MEEIKSILDRNNWPMSQHSELTVIRTHSIMFVEPRAFWWSWIPCVSSSTMCRVQSHYNLANIVWNSHRRFPIQSPWKLLLLCRTKNKFGLIFLISNMIDIKDVYWFDVCFAVHGPVIFSVTAYSLCSSFCKTNLKFCGCKFLQWSWWSLMF